MFTKNSAANHCIRRLGFPEKDMMMMMMILIAGVLVIPTCLANNFGCFTLPYVAQDSIKLEFTTTPMNTTSAKPGFLLEARASWKRPAGTFTGYGIRLVPIPSETDMITCAVNPLYDITTNESYTFTNLQHGTDYELRIRTVDTKNELMSLFVARHHATSPDCFEETAYREFCSNLKSVQRSGKPEELGVDRVVWLYNDTTVTVSVSWLQPLQVNANGNITKYRVRLTPTVGGSSLNSISKIVDPIKEHNIDDGPSVRQHQDMVDIPKDDEYKLSILPFVSIKDNIEAGLEASLVFNATPTVTIYPTTTSTNSPTTQDETNVTYALNNDSSNSPIDSADNVIDKPLWTPSPKVPKFATRAPNFLDQTDPVIWKSAIGVGLTVVFIVLLLIIFACWRLQRKRQNHVMRKTSFKKWNEELSIIKLPVPMMKNPEYKECDPVYMGKEFERCFLKIEKELGNGQFGVVYKGFAYGIDGTPDYTPVAVKSLKGNATYPMKMDFLEEIKLIIEIGSHPNILPVLGCITIDEPYYLITEFMKYGDLLHFLWQCREEKNSLEDTIYNLTETNKIQIARQITKGMEYLSTTRYYHGDLAARNILVGEGLVCKISDFGLADDIYQHGYKRLTPERKRPVKWVSPETNMEGKCTIQSDVWSFGIVLFEIYTLGDLPYPNMDGMEVIRKIRTGYRMQKPHVCPQDIYIIMQMCWRIKPSERPTFTQLLSKFDDMLASRADYLTAMGGCRGTSGAASPSDDMDDGGDYDQCVPLSSITEVDPSDIYSETNSEEIKSSSCSASSLASSEDALSIRSEPELKETDELMRDEDSSNIYESDNEQTKTV
ncbi:uncharacterized protein [Amphiura filiformis]|uniref:uncharacterized protein n=1 Tax=Amphiura filiformis TaxID=82378 RepID=UPI003B222CEE